MSGGVPAGWVLVPEAMTREMEDAWRNSPGLSCQVAWQAALAATPTPPIEGRDADVERDVRIILQAVADADSEDCIGSIDVDIPKGGYPRQWLRDAARAALQALGERG